MYCNSEFACALYFLKALFSNKLTISKWCSQPLVLPRILFKRNGALWETLPMFEYSIASMSWLLGITMTINQTANCFIRVYSLGFKKLAIFTRKQTNLLPSCLPRHSYPPSAVQMAASRPWVASGEKNTNPSVWESRCVNTSTHPKPLKRATGMSQWLKNQQTPLLCHNANV
jgi:hypothetical protein